MSLLEWIADALVTRGDLAHIALLLWAAAATGLALAALRALGEANARFDFVRELARFNRRHSGDET